MGEDEDKEGVARPPFAPAISVPIEQLAMAIASPSSSSAAASSLSSSSSSSSFPIYGVDRFPASATPLPPLPVSPPHPQSSSSSCSCWPCFASAAADCAAVCCCCPFSILSLAFLTCFRIPSAVADRVLAALKMKWRSRCSCRDPVYGFESSGSCPPQTWSSSRDSPIVAPGNSSPACFDDQQLLTHFGLSRTGFGIREDSGSRASN